MGRGAGRRSPVPRGRSVRQLLCDRPGQVACAPDRRCRRDGRDPGAVARRPRRRARPADRSAAIGDRRRRPRHRACALLAGCFRARGRAHPTHRAPSCPARREPDERPPDRPGRVGDRHRRHPRGEPSCRPRLVRRRGAGSAPRRHRDHRAPHGHRSPMRPRAHSRRRSTVTSNPAASSCSWGPRRRACGTSRVAAKPTACWSSRTRRTLRHSTTCSPCSAGSTAATCRHPWISCSSIARLRRIPPEPRVGSTRGRSSRITTSGRGTPATSNGSAVI